MKSVKNIVFVGPGVAVGRPCLLGTGARRATEPRRASVTMLDGGGPVGRDGADLEAMRPG